MTPFRLQATRLARASLASILVAVLSACGGGGNDAAATPSADLSAAQTTAPVVVAPAQPWPSGTLIRVDSAPAFVASAQAAIVLISANESPASPARFTVTQVRGPAVTELQLQPHGFYFRAPTLSVADTIVFQLGATDDAGMSTSSELSVLVGPVSSSGRLLTLIGGTTSPGLHWVITGDGFTAAEQNLLIASALRMARHTLAAPELAAHTTIWNVHLLTAASADSGVDNDGGTGRRDTAFDASLDCSRVERVACVSWDKVLRAVVAEAPAYDELAVILNTDTYLGSSSSSGVIVSRNTFGPEVMLHEMGHRVAGLADEYVDANIQDEFARRYVEGQFPNITRRSDAAQAPWRHWFVDLSRIPMNADEPGVGRFEGGYYTQFGFYRPKSDSFMRTVTAAIGEVNAEAWIRAQYRALPLLGDARPRAGAVRAVAGETVQLELVSPYAASVRSVRWYVDDREVITARDTLRMSHTNMDGGAHVVRAELLDVSGRIRDPAATEPRARVSWQLSPEAPQTNGKAEPSFTVAAPLLWLRMRVDGMGHSLIGLASRNPGQDPYGGPRRKFTLQEGPRFAYSLETRSGVTVAAGMASDPRVIRSATLNPAPGHGPVRHTFAVLDRGDYLIGIPAGEMPSKLRVTDAGNDALTAPGKLGPVEQVIDLEAIAADAAR